MNAKQFKNTAEFYQNRKNKKITLRKKISVKIRSLTLFKVIKKTISLIFFQYLYKYFYKSFVYYITITYLKFVLKYKNFTYYKIFIKSKNKDFHGNASFAYCTAITPKNEKAFIKIGNNLTNALQEAKVTKKFYNAAHKKLKCLRVIKSIETPIISFFACEYLDGATLQELVKQKEKFTKTNKERLLKQLQIVLEKFIEAEIYASKTCATHLDNLLISYNKKSELFITIIDFGKYKPYKKNKKTECIQNNIYNILNLVYEIKGFLKITNKEIDKYFGKYINIKS